MAIFDVNTDEVINLTAKLEKLHRSAFPSAVRNTLNNVAFLTKQKLPGIAENKFGVSRQKTFLKRFSIVDKAKGFNVNSMVSTVGINSSLNPKLAKNLESQEFGGNVEGKKIIPHKDARIGKSSSKRVSSSNRIPKINAHNATSAFKAHKGTRKSKFVSAVMSTAKSGKKQMLLKTGNRGMIYEFKSLKSNRFNKKISFKLKKLYVVRSNKNHNVRGVHFMLASANSASKQIPKIYKEAAEFQFKKALK